MPDTYENPDYALPGGSLTWVPPFREQADLSVIGLNFNSLRCERGKFRNDLPGANESATVSVEGVLVSPAGSEGWPLLAAFRPLARPNSHFEARPSAPLVIKAAAKNTGPAWIVELASPSRLSAITLEYAITVSWNDPDLLALMDRGSGPSDEESDAFRLRAYQDARNRGEGVTAPKIDLEKYFFGKVEARKPDGTWVEFPVADEGGNPLALAATALAMDATRTNYPTVTATIRFDTRFRAAFFAQSYTAVRVGSRYGLRSQVLHIRRAMLFDAADVNIDQENLPCQYLQYAVGLNVRFNPLDAERFGSYFPYAPDLSVPNLHVKLFSPDDTSGTVGFAHSIRLRFLVTSARAFISPGGTSLLGVLNDIATGGAFFSVFTGPMVGQRSLRFNLSLASPQPSGRVVLATQGLTQLRSDTTSFEFQRTAEPSDDFPAEATEWETFASYPGGAAPSGSIIAPFTAADAAGVARTWYRVVQVGTSVGRVTGAPVRGTVWSERATQTLVDSELPMRGSAERILRRASDVNLSAAQVLSDATRPVALYVDEGSAPVQRLRFLAGAFRLGLNAGTLDTRGWVNTHLAARIWLVPEGEVVSLTGDPYQWRGATEVYFDSDGTNGTRLVRGRPTQLSQLLVTPPLPAVASQSAALPLMQLIRYVQSFSGVGVSGSDFTLPFGADVRGRFVVALYSFSYLTDAGNAAVRAGQFDPNGAVMPAWALELNAANAALETPFIQTLSGRLLPQRAGNFSKASYTSVAAAANATKRLVSDLGAPIGGWQVYNRTFVAGSDAGAALTGLCRFEQAAGDLKVALPWDTIPASMDHNVAVRCDFATSGPSLSGGRVNAGAWSVAIRYAAGGDVSRLDCDVRLEGLLVTSDGRVVHRVFASDWLTRQFTRSTSRTIRYAFNVANPFLITGTETQFVLRLVASPYTRDGQPADLERLGELASPSPLGLRIESVNLVSHTLERLNIDQTASVAGSPAYYENYPLVPAQTLGAQDFNLFMDPALIGEESGGFFITFADQDNPMMGTLYSPVYKVPFPDTGVEADVRMAGLNTSGTVFAVRTVLGASAAEQVEQSVGACEEPLTGLIHAAHEEVSGEAEQTVIRHYVQDYPLGPTRSALVQGLDGANGDTQLTLTGSRPFLSLVRLSDIQGVPFLVGMTVQVAPEGGADAYPLVRFVVNPHSGLPGRWMGPNRDLVDTDFSDQRFLVRGLSFPTFAQGMVSSLVYVAGWMQPGAVVVAEVNPWDAGRGGGEAFGPMYVVDGVKEVAAPPGVLLVIPPEEVSGLRASATAPAVIQEANGRLLVAYALEGEDGILRGRRTTAGVAFGPTFQLVDFLTAAGGPDPSLRIYAPVFGQSAVTGETWLAFWANGRVFVRPLLSSQSDGQTFPSILVAGPSKTDGAGDGAMALLVQGGAVAVDQLGAEEKAVPRQRVGLIVPSEGPYAGGCLVYYLDGDGALQMRVVLSAGRVSAPLKMSS